MSSTPLIPADELATQITLIDPETLTTQDRYKIVHTDGNPINDAQTALLANIANTLGAYLQEEGKKRLHPKIAEDPLFARLLTDPNFATTDLNLTQLVPNHSKWEEVYRILELQARKILKDKKHETNDSNIKATLLGLIYLTRERLKAVTRDGRIRANIQTTDPEKRRYFSPLELKRAVSSIATMNLSLDESLIKLLTTLGIITEHQGISEKDKIIRSIQAAIETARNFLHSEVKKINAKMQDLLEAPINEPRITKISETIVYPEIGTNTTHTSAFKMLEVLFTEGIKAMPDRKVIRDLTDYQATLYLAFHLFRYQYDPTITKAQLMQETFMTQIFLNLLNNKEVEQKPAHRIRYIDKPLHPEFKQSTDQHIETDLYRFTLPNGDTLLVKKDWGNLKEPISLAIKHTIGASEQDPSELFDILRARFILFDFTINDFRNPGEQQNRAKEFAEICAKSINNNLQKVDKKREDLTEGEFTIELPNKETMFPKITIYLVHQGVKAEIQIIPQQLDHIQASERSPFNHENYKGALMARLLLMLFPESANPEFHATLVEIIRQQKESRDRGQQALEKFLIKDQKIDIDDDTG